MPRHVGTKIPRAKGHRLDHLNKQTKKKNEENLGNSLSLLGFKPWLGNEDPHKPCGAGELKKKKNKERKDEESFLYPKTYLNSENNTGPLQ